MEWTQLRSRLDKSTFHPGIAVITPRNFRNGETGQSLFYKKMTTANHPPLLTNEPSILQFWFISFFSFFFQILPLPRNVKDDDVQHSGSLASICNKESNNEKPSMENYLS